MTKAAGVSLSFLNEPLGMLYDLCTLYDNGDHAAAQKIAATLIALLEGPRSSVDKEKIGFKSFISTVYPEEATMDSGFRLCWTGATTQESTQISYTPKLGHPLTWYTTTFANWWNNEVVINEVVVPRDYHLTFSRHKLCLFLQDKGTATFEKDDEPFLASIRHIAFEFLESVSEYYKNTPPHNAGEALAIVHLRYH